MIKVVNLLFRLFYLDILSIMYINFTEFHNLLAIRRTLASAVKSSLYLLLPLLIRYLTRARRYSEPPYLFKTIEQVSHLVARITTTCTESGFPLTSCPLPSLFPILLHKSYVYIIRVLDTLTPVDPSTGPSSRTTPPTRSFSSSYRESSHHHLSFLSLPSPTV